MMRIALPPNYKELTLIDQCDMANQWQNCARDEENHSPVVVTSGGLNHDHQHLQCGV